MKRLEDYTVVSRPDDNGTSVAYVPAIPGCHAWDRTPDEALAELRNVFDMVRDEYQQAQRPLPEQQRFRFMETRR